MKSNRPRSLSGFTLVEILTATAIMAVIIGFVMTIMTQVLDVWNSSSDELELSGQAQVALNLIKQDLEQAYFRHDGSQWFVLTSEVPVSVGSFQEGSASSSPTSFQILPSKFSFASRLILFAPTTVRETTDSSNPANPIFGDVCAIEYRMTYGPLFPVNSSGQPVLALHRAVINPWLTLIGFSGITGKALSASGANSTPTVSTLMMGNATTVDLMTAWNGTDSGTIKQGADSPYPETYTGPNGTGLTYVYGGLTTATTVLYNVAQFLVTVNFYDTTQPSGISAYSYTAFRYGGNQNLNGNSTLLPLQFPPLASVSPNNPVVEDYTGAQQLTDTSMLPPYNLAYADITLTLLTADGSYLFARNPSNYLVAGQAQGGGTQGAWEQFLLQYGRTFTERVYFQNTPQ